MVNSPGELWERRELVGLFGLYALYRRLCPPAVLPDAKLYKRLWSIQKEVPVVVLHARAIWFAPEFLTKYAAYENVKKLDPPDVEGMSFGLSPSPIRTKECLTCYYYWK